MTKKEQQSRKQYLDQLMQEYDYNMNNIDATIEFLAVMWSEYRKIKGA